MKTSLNLLFSFIMLWNYSIAQAHVSDDSSPPYVLTHKEYEGIKATAKEVLSKHSFDDTIFVGIGRSPTPIIAFLELLSPGSTRQLPLSDAANLFRLVERNPHAEKQLEKHLDIFLGDIAYGPKKLVFIDFVAGSGGFRYALALIEKYFQNKPGFRFDYLALRHHKEYVSYDGYHIEKFRQENKWPAFDKTIVLNQTLLPNLVHSIYDYVSLYGYWVPNSKAPKTRWWLPFSKPAINYVPPGSNKYANDYFVWLIQKEMSADSEYSYLFPSKSCANLFK